MPERNPRWYGVHRCAGRRHSAGPGKAAVLRDLLEHVVEESEPVAMELGPSGTSPPRHAHRFPWSCGASGPPRLSEDALCDRGHVSCGPPSKVCAALHPEVRRELHIRVPIAHHEAARGVECASREILPHHPGLVCGIRIVPLEMRTDEYFIELDALRREQLQDEPVGRFEFLPGKTGGPQSILVGHHDEPEPGALQVQQRGMTPGMSESCPGCRSAHPPFPR